MDKFIPKPYKKEPISLRMEIERIAQLDRLATKYDLSRSELVNRCVEYAISHMTDRDITEIGGEEDDEKNTGGAV